MSVTVHANRIKPYFSSDLRPSNTLEGTSANSGPAIPDEDLPADSFSDYHPIKHTRDSQHEPAASDPPMTQQNMSLASFWFCLRRHVLRIRDSICPYLKISREQQRNKKLYKGI